MPKQAAAHLTPKLTLNFPKRLPRTVRRQVEDAIECLIDVQVALIAYLDRMDGDADLEPSLGAWASYNPHSFAPEPLSQIPWAVGGSDDREIDTGDDEPSLTSAEGHNLQFSCSLDLELNDAEAAI